MGKQILDGVKIVSLETSVSGPFSSVLLADFGAEVIKVEMPNRGDIARRWDTVANGQSGYFVNLNRNKKSIELDLKSAADIEILLDLIRDADVFIENYKPDAIEKFGLTYERLSKINSKLIYCGISGYGKDGPYKNEPAYDPLIQAESGLVSLTGTEKEPAKVGVSVCDLTTGLYSAMAISLALLNREKTGKGAEIDMSMFECAMSLLLPYPMYYWYRGQVPKRRGMKHAIIVPSGAYFTQDKKYVAFSIDRDDEWKKFCNDVLEHPELASDQRFLTNEKRQQNRMEMETALDAIFQTGTQEKWLSRLKVAKIACSRVNDLSDVVIHPQTLYRKFISEVQTEAGSVKYLGNPIRIAGYPPLSNPVPSLGQNNDEIRQRVRSKS
ncbi:MAG: CoA transferase [Nitrososphaerota archaeon]|nr:CoA transferase [Nitrososphaerota archaeon]